MGREITEAQHTWLAGELAAWCERGIVTAPQAEAVLGLYGTAEDFRERRQSKAMLTLVSLAVLLVGLAVLLLIGYNWEAMPAGLKLVRIFGALIGTHTGGFYLRYNTRVSTASEPVFFLAACSTGRASGSWPRFFISTPTTPTVCGGGRSACYRSPSAWIPCSFTPCSSGSLASG